MIEQSVLPKSDLVAVNQDHHLKLTLQLSNTQQLISMGFLEANAAAALSISNGNMENALERLLSGFDVCGDAALGTLYDMDWTIEKEMTLTSDEFPSLVRGFLCQFQSYVEQ